MRPTGGAWFDVGMSRLDDLRALGAKIDPSLLPTQNELPAVLGALIAEDEHGDELAKAESPQDVSNVLTGAEPEQVNPQAGPVPAPAPVAPTSGASSDPVAPQVSTPSPENPSVSVPTDTQAPSAPDAPVANVVADPPAPSVANQQQPDAAAAAAEDRAELDSASDSELDARLADLQARISARRATAQQSQVSHEPGAGG